MASSSTAFSAVAVALAPPKVGAGVVRSDTSKQLSSSSAFCSSVVQLAPLRPASRGGIVGAKASWSEEAQQKTASGGKLVASVLAAGVALGISGQAFAANPAALVNEKVSQLPSPNGAIENVQSAAGNAVNETKRRSDGIFGKKAAAVADKARSSSSSGGKAVEDATSRVQDFASKSQNPIATNVEKAAKETEGLGSLGDKSGSAIANRELLGQDSSRVDAATGKAENLATELQKKAGEAVDDIKQVFGNAQDAATPSDLQSSIDKEVQSAKEAAGKVQNPFQ